MFNLKRNHGRMVCSYFTPSSSNALSDRTIGNAGAAKRTQYSVLGINEECCTSERERIFSAILQPGVQLEGNTCTSKQG